MPETGPSPRPRPRPITSLPDPQKQLLEALEAVHQAARAAGLPKVHLDWDKTENGTPESRREAEIKAYTAAFFADLEGVGEGPWPDSLAALQPPPDPDSWLIEGFIRPGTTVMLTGPPSSSKSWAARQLAFAAGAGLDAFLERYPVARPLNVLVIDEDNGPHEEWRRDEALLAHLGLQRSDLKRVERLSLAGIQLDQPAWQVWLRGMIRTHELELLVLDPISEMHGGKELREDPAFRSLLGFLKRLKIDFPRLATLLVHHTRKLMQGSGSNRSLDDVRGQWGQTPDAVALMWPLGDRRAAWELHKRVPHSKLILEATEAGPVQFVADDTTSRSKGARNDDLVIDAIRGGLTTHSDIAEGTELAKGTVTGVLKRLVAARVIEKRGLNYAMREED